jgi:threonine dehydratase
MITPLDVLAARRRIARYLQPTPLRHSTWLSEQTRATVHLKLESVQLTNSFKIRGALNAALRVLEEARDPAADRRPIVTASAGNHGRALALVSERLGLRTTVFTPRTAPETKRAAIRHHGVVLRDDAADYDAAEQAAREYAGEHRALYLSPYNHPDVIAGAGTPALEILDVLPSFDVLVVPLGGGGLASGLGTVVRAAGAQVRVVGVEAAASTPFARSLAAGEITAIDPQSSLADGLTGNLEPDSMTFDIVQRVVTELVSVDEDEIASAIRGLAAEEHVIAEGAGAVATAAVLGKQIVKPGEIAVVMVTGGNIDTATLAGILSRNARESGDRRSS